MPEVRSQDSVERIAGRELKCSALGKQTRSGHPLRSCLARVLRLRRQDPVHFETVLPADRRLTKPAKSSAPAACTSGFIGARRFLLVRQANSISTTQHYPGLYVDQHVSEKWKRRRASLSEPRRIDRARAPSRARSHLHDVVRIQRFSHCCCPLRCGPTTTLPPAFSRTQEAAGRIHGSDRSSGPNCRPTKPSGRHSAISARLDPHLPLDRSFPRSSSAKE